MPDFAHHYEENYLKALFKLSNKEIKKVNNITLAKYMELNPATVLEMVRKMEKRKLVHVLPDKSIKLTETGEKEAILIIRKHRLWEVFLVDKLDYKWNEVHELAEQLEHIDSDEMINRLEVFLEFPSFDPHGDPIPDKNGKLKVNMTIPLISGKKGKNYKVKNFAETNDAFLDYLGKLNILPGTRIKILDVHEYDQSCSVQINKNIFQLSEKAAKNILVQLNN
jgi:DtxR family Mn-dependent transcriptional regulator